MRGEERRDRWRREREARISSGALLESRGGGESVVPLGKGGTRGGRR